MKVLGKRYSDMQVQVPVAIFFIFGGPEVAYCTFHSYDGLKSRPRWSGPGNWGINLT